MDRAEQLLGIVSERDVVRSLAANGARTLEMTAGQLMTRALQIATPRPRWRGDAHDDEGRFATCRDRSRQVVGLISIGDVVKTRIMQQAQEVDSLRAYVSGAA